MQNGGRGRPEKRTQEVDALFPGRDGGDLLRGAVRVRPKAVRRRQHHANGGLGEALQGGLQQQMVQGYAHKVLQTET